MPGLVFWNPAFKDEKTTGEQCSADRLESRRPVVVRHEDLGDVPRHGGQVGLQGRQRRRIAQDLGVD